MTPARIVRKQASWAVVPWIVSLGLLALCIPFVRYQGVVDTIGRAQPIYMIIGTILLVLDRALMALRWHILLRAGELRIGFSETFVVLLKASAVSLFIPAIGGDVTKLFYLRSKAGAEGAIVASLVLDRIVGLVTALLMAGIGLWLISLYAGVTAQQAETVIVFLILAGMCLVALNALLSRKRGQALRGAIRGKIAAFARVKAAMVREALAVMVRGTGTLLKVAVVAVAEQLMQITVLVLMAVGMGLEETVLFVGLVAVQWLLMRLPITPDGWGLGEFTAVQSYGVVGMTAETALVTMLLFHVCATLVVAPALVVVVRDGLSNAAASVRRTAYGVPPERREAT